MKWAEPLIRISTYEVETLQKRLADIVTARWAIEMRLASLEAEDQAETRHAKEFAETGVYLAGFREGVKIRKAGLLAELAQVEAEEAGARDALSEAFEALKKFEHVAQNAKLAAAKEAARRETVIMDDLGRRKAAR